MHSDEPIMEASETIVDLDRHEVLSLLREVQELSRPLDDAGDDLEELVISWFG